MTTFDERQKGFENKFKYDQELNFKIKAKRNKTFGLWIAHHLNLEGEDAEAYARQVMAADLEKSGHDDMIDKVVHDLEHHECTLSRHQVERELHHIEEKIKHALLKQREEEE